MFYSISLTLSFQTALPGSQNLAIKTVGFSFSAKNVLKSQDLWPHIHRSTEFFKLGAPGRVARRPWLSKCSKQSLLRSIAEWIRIGLIQEPWSNPGPGDQQKHPAGQVAKMKDKNRDPSTATGAETCSWGHFSTQSISQNQLSYTVTL